MKLIHTLTMQLSVNLAGDIFLNFVLSAAVEVTMDLNRCIVVDWEIQKKTSDARRGGWHDRNGLHWQGLTPRHLPTHRRSQVADA